ncbi:MAG: two-component regulator propeller domain-containing protein [Bacteroidota bacterium]
MFCPRFFYISLIFCSLKLNCCQQISAQERELIFEHIGVADGLSQGTVNHIMKDNKGFMWVATQDGLNRFDGYDFKIYRKDPANPNSLANNFVWTTWEDVHGTIWIGTFGGGLNKLDPSRDQFTSFVPATEDIQHSLAHTGVRAFFEVNDSTLLIGTDYGLSVMNTRTDQIRTFHPELEGAAHYPGQNVLALGPMIENRVMVGDKYGVYAFDLQTERFSPIFELRREEGRQSFFVSEMVGGEEGELWVSTSRGLLLLSVADSSKKRVKKYFYHRPDQPTSLHNNSTNSLYLDQDRLWIGTAEGLAYLPLDELDKPSPVFGQEQHDPRRAGSLSNNQVNQIFDDEAGFLWIASKEGLNKLAKRTPMFSTIGFEEDGRGLCNATVLGMEEDTEGNLWVGTVGGLTKITNWKQENRTFSCYHLPDYFPAHAKSDYVLNVCKDNQGQIWVCTRRGGIGRLISDSSGALAFEHYSPDPNDPASLGSSSIYFLLQDKEGMIWLGTSGGGVNAFDPNSGRFTHYTHDPKDSTKLPHPYAYALLEDYQDRFWVGTAGGGLSKMDRKTGICETYAFREDDPNSLSNDMVLCLYESKAKQLWVGTANGLCLMESEGVFRRFFEKDGLPNNVIYGIMEDKNGNLWVSTSKGITRVRYESNQFSTLNFDPSDGLSGWEFNQFSYHQSGDGTMVFGGVKGVTIFHPDSFRLNHRLPHVVLTGFKLFNQVVPVAGLEEKADELPYALPMTISEVKQIELPYHQNFLSFEFAALEFTNPSQNQYAYRLAGVDQGWVYSGTRRFADYPNLNSGDYIFQVKASNNDGIWNEKASSLMLSIAPPPWKTWWAYLLYVLMIGGSIYALIRYRTRKVRQEVKMQAKIEQVKVEERELVRAQSSRDFHDEAGNHLTKISLYTGLIKRGLEQASKLGEYADHIEANLMALSGGMRDFIWVLDPQKDGLDETIQRLIDFGYEMFEHSEIEFVAKNQIHEEMNIRLEVSAKRNLLLIFKEAMNNALKYAKASTVQFTIKLDNDHLYVELRDDGLGFDREKLVRVNGLNNMKSRAKEMSAELNVHAVPGVGTRIVVEKSVG